MTFPRTLKLIALLGLPACLGLANVSCSSSGEATTAADGGVVESTTGAVLKPCGLHVTYQGKDMPGDDQCIEAPDPSQGFQFHYGPSSYTDETEMAKFILQPGQETTDCVFFKTTNDVDLYFNEYHSRLRPGSHHMLLYIQSESVDGAGPSDCNQTLSRNLFGATSPTMDVTNDSNAPENNGLAARIPPKQQVVMQLHVINAGATPILREAWANIYFTDKSNVKIVGDPIFFLGGVAMSIPVGTTVLNHGTATVPANASKDFRLVLGIPHYHGHTTRFTAYKIVDGVKTPILEQYGVLGVPGDPQLIKFDSLTKNPPVDPNHVIPGAYSGDIYLKPGDQIYWECVQTNDGKGLHGEPFTTPLQFTEQAYLGEMCNMFGMYAPSTDPTGDGTWKSVFNP